MESTRQKKVARLLQKELGSIFRRKGNEMGGIMITVTVVRISPDLGVSKVYLSIFPSGKANSAIEKIRQDASQIRHELGNIVRHQLRIVPELNFFIDDSLDYIDRIDELLNK